MTVFLHIGSHKTSTTAIQHFASRNRAWLFENGLIYSSYDLIGEAAPRSHLSLVKQLAVKNVAPEIKEKALMVLERANEIAQAEAKNVLFSAESLFRLHDEARMRVCDALTSAFGSENLVIIAGLRSQAELSDSLYRNAYREYRVRPEAFETWLKGHSHLLDYEGVLAAYKAGLGTEKEILLPYHSAGRTSFVSDFFKAVGVDIQDAPLPSVNMNTSLSPLDCLAKAEVLGDDPDPEVADAFNAFARQSPLKSDFGFVSPEIELFLRESYRVSNSKIIERAPHMIAALSDDRPLLGQKPMTDETLALAQSRVAEFHRHYALKA